MIFLNSQRARLGQHPLGPAISRCGLSRRTLVLGVTTAFVLLLTASPVGAFVYTSGNIAVPIPDCSTVCPGVATSSINIGDSQLVHDINVQVRLNHTYDHDLRIYLIGPDGTTVLLAN